MSAERRRLDRSARGGKAREAGRRQEVLAAALLMLKGYRILGFRLRTPQGEIDILAERRRVLVVVEVKSRATLLLALEAVRPEQRERLRRAARAIASGRPGLRDHAIRLDLVAVAPGRWPRHVIDAWRSDNAG